MMHFTIRRAECEEDWEFFYKLGFKTLKILRRSFYDQLVKDNPDKSEAELLVAHRKETEDYFDFDDPKSRVFIAKNQEGVRCGYLWMGERNSEDYWDLQRPQWIYDIVVEPTFRGNGLGTLLLRKAEEFALEMNRNIGLFVHEVNTSATNLYKKEGYFIKCIPMSLKVPEEVSTRAAEGYTIREMMASDADAIRESGFASYQSMASLSKDIPERQLLTKYDEYLEKVEDLDRDKCTFVIETADKRFAGFAIVGIAGFSDTVGMVFDSAIKTEHKRPEVVTAVMDRLTGWCKEHALKTLYYLLHASDDISQDALTAIGFAVPGFFMEKDLVRTL